MEEELKEGMDSYAVMWTKRYMAIWNQGYESLPKVMGEEQAKVAACNTMMIAARDSGVLKVPKELIPKSPKDIEAQERLDERMKDLKEGMPKPAIDTVDKKATDLAKEIKGEATPGQGSDAKVSGAGPTPVDHDTQIQPTGEVDVMVDTNKTMPVEEKKEGPKPECKGILTHEKKGGKKAKAKEEAEKEPEKKEESKPAEKPKAPAQKQTSLTGDEIPLGFDGQPIPAYDRNKPGWNYCPLCNNMNITHPKNPPKKGDYQACWECRAWLPADSDKPKPMDN